MTFDRVRRFGVAVFGAVLWGTICLGGDAFLYAQGPTIPSAPRPGPPSPRPSAPRSGGSRPSPSYNRPSPNRNPRGYTPPNRFNANPNQPGRPGYQPGRPGNQQPGQPNYRPGQPGYQPGQPNPYGSRYSAPTARPFTTFTPPRPQVPVPGQAYAPRIHAAPVHPITGSQWGQAQRQAQSGQFSAAQKIIDQQLKNDRSLNGLMNAVSVMEQAGAPRSALTPYRNQAYKLARQNAKQGVSDPMPWVAIAKFSLEDQDDTAFNQATNTLIKQFPNHEYSAYFNGMRAIKNEDWKTAERELQRAKELGLPNDAVAEWLKLVIDRQKIIWDFAYYTVYLILGWIAGMVVLYLAGKLLSAWTLRSVRNGYTDRITPSQRWLRRVYRFVVGIAGIYYYLSLPMVLLLSIALPLSIGYALLMVPALNLYLIALVLVAGIGGLVTAVSGIRACFIRPQPIDDQAARLSRDENPDFWKLVGNVAEQVGTRTVDEIVLAPGAEIGVYELGGYLRKLRDRGRRVLVLGAAALDGLSVPALRGILAHEFGHFLNRDTAGGRMTLQVNLAIDNFVVALMMRRKVRWWDLGIHFLRFYYLLYARLTFGASRLQELHSDFVAVSNYGPTAFRDGLAHVVRRSIEFDNQLDTAFERTLKKGSAPAQFYGKTGLMELDDLEAVEATICSLLNEPSSEGDSHPSPSERFAIVEKSGIADPDGSAAGNEPPAWGLLPNRESLLGPIVTQIREALEERSRLFKHENELVLEQLTWALKRNSEADVLRFERAIVCFRMKKYEAALEDVSALIEENDHSVLPPDVFLLRAEIHHDQGNYERSAKNLALLVEEKAISDMGIYCRLASCYMRTEQYRDAADTYSRALKLNGKLLPALLGRGRAYTRLKMTKEAEQDFAKVNRYYPNTVGPYGLQSSVLEESLPS